jgi:hypothetical protein
MRSRDSQAIELRTHQQIRRLEGRAVHVIDTVLLENTGEPVHQTMLVCEPMSICSTHRTASLTQTESPQINLQTSKWALFAIIVFVI